MRRSHPPVLLAAAMLALAAACAAPGGAGNAERPRPAGSPDTVASAPARGPGTPMRAHFEEVRQIELALLFGHLDAARFHARLLASKVSESGFAAPSVAGVVRLAGELAATERIDGAFQLAAELAGECAACHRASGVTVALPLVAEPSEDGSIAGRMARHQWAADRMWEGLVASSDRTWRDGLAILAEEPLLPEAMSDDRELYARLDHIAGDLAQLARDARVAAPGHPRAAAFGDLLSVCSACHVLVRP
jgi:hypothetical protein